MLAGGSRDCERFPELREHLGEDPARWLDWPILVERDRERLVRTRIESIDRIEVIRAWKAVERALGRGDDGGHGPVSSRRSTSDGCRTRESNPGG
ncbi:hypothetical protein SAMN05216559_1104 [Halomicrobium zhouii]|uniref:Uncharacterized protein n=1 Tax=Halomicrobium zhouii TaxID=767519 RepID=A0A1I6KN29_9EURY|nr:hypothetical protein [Halomicrobium zhouii]SFR92584.1 hypothetical protein SAMN05216559_1104 [Halomicrobium zhouii]